MVPIKKKKKKTLARVFLSRDDSSKLEQDRAAILFRTHGPHCIYVNFYPRPLWLVFILVIPSLNLVVSCPYVSYY